MQLEVGGICEGKITGVKKFGAFVRLPDGSTGMVHISEVSNQFIQERADVLSEGELVNVKGLSGSPEGKIARSIKQTQTQPPPAARPAPRQRQGRPADTGRV